MYYAIIIILLIPALILLGTGIQRKNMALIISAFMFGGLSAFFHRARSVGRDALV